MHPCLQCKRVPALQSWLSEVKSTVTMFVPKKKALWPSCHVSMCRLVDFLRRCSWLTSNLASCCVCILDYFIYLCDFKNYFQTQLGIMECSKRSRSRSIGMKRRSLIFGWWGNGINVSVSNCYKSTNTLLDVKFIVLVWDIDAEKHCVSCFVLCTVSRNRVLWVDSQKSSPLSPSCHVSLCRLVDLLL